MTADAPDRGPLSGPVLALLLAVALGVAAGFMSLGVWQLERRAWKLELIDRVAQRVQALPVDAPGRAAWPTLDVAAEEYRRVRASGRWLAAPDVLVRASTAYGRGFWLMSPLALSDGGVLLVNRGWVSSPASAEAARPPPGPVSVVGLLRRSEPGRAWPWRNEPDADRWATRDVEAIAAARGLAGMAPYYLDAQAAAGEAAVADAGQPRREPIGGLTVTDFRNDHLVYALTWFALALMTLGAAALLLRSEWRLRRR